MTAEEAFDQAIKLLHVTSQEIRLAAGELTANEIRAVQAGLGWKCWQLQGLRDKVRS